MSNQFWIVVKDEDNKTFNVLGPRSDDTAVTKAVYEARKTGRNVNCHTCPLKNDPDRQALINEYAKEFRVTHTDTPIV